MPHYKCLSEEMKRSASFMLLGLVKDKELPRGAIVEISKKFSVHRSTISRLWKKTRATLLNTEAGGHEDSVLATTTDLWSTINPVDDKKTNIFATRFHERTLGKVYDRAAVKQQVTTIPLKKRTTYKRLAKELQLSTTTIWRMVREENNLRRHTSSVKPTLTNNNKVQRIEFALTKIDNNSRGPLFIDMMNEVHVDEKWFFITKNQETYIMSPDEDEPKRNIKHKGYVTKVMFLCAMARPRYDATKRQMWDGKVGLWPIGHFAPAQRSSVNRPSGTPIWNNDTVDREMYRKFLINDVLPAIVDCWPASEWNDENTTIHIQQDGAKAHIACDDEEWMNALRSFGVQQKINIYTQPPNSPDCNINDLGFFNSLQAEYNTCAPSSATDILTMVDESFHKLKGDTINRIWLTYQSCLNAILDNHGHNEYKIPHLGKETLEKNGSLPLCLKVTPNASFYFEE